MSTQYEQIHDTRGSPVRKVGSANADSDTTHHLSRLPILVYVLLGTVLFQGVSGVAGGIGLLMDPTGATLGIPQTWLAGSPFPDYTVPGFVLLTMLGAYPLLTFYGLLRGRQWGYFASLSIGLALLVWLLVEVLTIGYHAQPPLQAIYSLVAFVILFVALAPSVRSYYSIGGPAD